jgi:hypothetical protein
MRAAYGRCEPVSWRREGSRSIRLMISRAVVTAGRRWTTEPSVSISTSPKPRGPQFHAQRAAGGRVGVGQDHHVAVEQFVFAFGEHVQLLVDARVVRRVGEDHERAGDPAQILGQRGLLGVLLFGQWPATAGIVTVGALGQGGKGRTAKACRARVKRQAAWPLLRPAKISRSARDARAKAVNSPQDGGMADGHRRRGDEHDRSGRRWRGAGAAELKGRAPET